MVFDFNNFISRFSKGRLTNKQLFEIVEEHVDYIFFTELKDFLFIESDRSEIEVQELYSKICYAYFMTKRYFKEH